MPLGCGRSSAEEGSVAGSAKGSDGGGAGLVEFNSASFIKEGERAFNPIGIEVVWGVFEDF